MSVPQYQAEAEFVRRLGRPGGQQPPSGRHALLAERRDARCAVR
ncbi:MULTISPECIES: hypothetical protein [Streptomyces]|uniref:Uncharacterized protein n=2 Tax=Streptomyces TaxID=1883 RepID=A0ABU4KHU1_9ACTN|nr:hypothetical protein [Streptomyces roseolus]MDX2297367.1 hypothetical protein [Streptomyces roseolus]